MLIFSRAVLRTLIIPMNGLTSANNILPIFPMNNVWILYLHVCLNVIPSEEVITSFNRSIIHCADSCNISL
uniref:Uncharacterized protein n=1 Tax=Lepeophtheirus salmonis TaxID=72036 RepID=A0A0K2UVW4_LEPSM